MRLVSMLFVPGDRPERMEKALGSGADALILDLEDSVSAANKQMAREGIAAFLDRPRTGVTLFVRINPLQGDMARDDLAAVMPHGPDGICLPKAEGLSSIRELESLIGDAPCAIFPLVTETPLAMFRLGEYAGASNRICGLTWGAEDLPAAIGATQARNPDGTFTPPLELARSMTLFAAHAAGVEAIETISPDFRDLDALRRYAERAAADGFSGMMAIHPAQVPVINAAFTPSAETVAHAQAVVEAFAAAPGAGVLSIDGQMIDAPHLKQAQRTLARAGL
ncbi:MAG: CoA ester lyase [Alphaproteobacteria bacterium]|nr:CoA ester lyase [Alphaproteobacteria bacterium]